MAVIDLHSRMILNKSAPNTM